MSRLLCAICLCVLAAVCPSAPVTAQEFPPPLARLELQDGDAIVFLGDSITHQRLYTQYVEDYFYTRFPRMRLQLHNAGVGGARAWDALQRFDQDVAAFKPKYVTILLGMNDGTYRPYDHETFQTYRQDMSELLTQIQAIGATPVLMSPTMFDARAQRMNTNPRRERDPESVTLYNSVLAFYGTWLRDVAESSGFGFVDMWSPLNNLTLQQRKSDPTFTLIQDAIHPGPAGQVVMATALISDLGLPRAVSSIRIFKQAGGDARATATGGKLTELAFTDEEVRFTWQADALPWVLPEEARIGVELTRLGHRLSGEKLEVHNLPPGRYALQIDGTDVGTYDATALARHIELQSNEATPQFQQSLQVARLNKERNEGPIGTLRSEWSRFQTYARARRAAQEQPDNAELAAQLRANEEKVRGMDERVAAALEAAEAAEDRIFEVNQPPARRYVIRRID
jgi:lysophospholipase L1-like esterase